MSPNEMLSLVTGFFPWGFAKLSILIIIAMYTVFAAVIVRQEQLMSRVVESQSSVFLKVVAMVHLLVSICAFILALILL